MPLTASQLSQMTCSSENCGNSACTGEMAFHSGCHPGYPTWAFYLDGRLTIKCAACEAVIAVVAVAP